MNDESSGNGKGSPHLTELSRMIEMGLPEMGDDVAQSTGFVYWSTPKGTCLAWEMPTLLPKDRVGVCQSFLTKGTLFPYHTHQQSNSQEILVCVEGKLIVRVGGKVIATMVTGDSVSLDPDQRHEVESPEMDSWVIGITVPRDPGYPG